MMLRKIALSVSTAAAVISAPLAIASPANAAIEERCYGAHCSVGPFATFAECDAVKDDYATRHVILASCADVGTQPRLWFFAYHKPVAG